MNDTDSNEPSALELARWQKEAFRAEMNRGFEMTRREKFFLGFPTGSAYWAEIAEAICIRELL